MNNVTIIIPVYNSEKYIGRCLDSILNQSYKNIDILIINDGSKDKSKEIIEKYQEKYSNIILINQENIGVANTRNKAIKIAKTKYIMFVDDDDYIDNDYIKNYIDEIENSNLDIVIGGYKRVNIEGKILFKQKLDDYNWSKYIIVAPWAKIYNKDFLLKNNIEFLDYSIGEDVYFNLLAFSKNPKIKIIDNIGYNWFFNTKSVSNTSQKGLNNNIDLRIVMDKIRQNCNGNDEYTKYYLKRYFIWYMLFSGKKSSTNNFKNYYNLYNKWFKDNKVKSTISPFSLKIKGENLKNRLCVALFLFLEKLHIIQIFARIYCKGEDV